MSIKSEDIVPLEREHIYFALLQEAVKGLEDVRDGRVATARQMLAEYKVKRTGFTNP